MAKFIMQNMPKVTPKTQSRPDAARPPALATPKPDEILTCMQFLKYLEPHEQVFTILIKNTYGRSRGTLAQWKIWLKELGDAKVGT